MTEYGLAKEKYAALGIDTEAVIEKLKNIAKNIHKTITLEENLDISYSYVKKENLSIQILCVKIQASIV